MEDKKQFKEYPILGRMYQHYKGGLYEVVTLAKHTETEEDLVIYKSIQFGTIYARPLDIWNGKVGMGIDLKRFEIVR